MKKTLLFLGISFCSSALFATTYSHTSTVDRIGSIQTRSDSDYVILSGFTTAGSCPRSDGLVIARFASNDAGNRAYSLALSAKMAGGTIRVAVDDDVKNPDGSCMVKSIEMN